MRVGVKIHSIPIVYDETSKNGFFTLNAYELSLLWTIVKNKPMSLYDLSKQEFSFPKNRAASTIPIGNIDAYWSQTGEAKTKHYPFIQKVVKRLEEKGLVIAYKDTSGPRSRKIVAPTFKGIIYFLQSEPPFQEKAWKQIVKSIENHKEVLSFFLDSLGSIGAYIESKVCVNAFMETVWESNKLGKVRVSIRHLDMTFDGYLEDQKRFFMKRLQYMDANFHKEPKMNDYLCKNEALEVRNAYLAYLAMNDIILLSVANKQDLRYYAPILISERELAQFERREVGSNFLFDGERPKEFFPKYSGLQSFFVGMFVRNLLWGPLEEAVGAKVEKTHDYEIQELY